MTLIITVLTANKVLQASDRRLTSTTDGSVLDDEANKAVCVGCKDAYFSIAYTGLASINTMNGTMKTDEWLLGYLISIYAFQMDVSSISKALEGFLTTTFSPFPKENKRATFVLAGYKHYRPFRVIISNFERENLWPPGEAQNRFLSYFGWMKKNDHTETAYSIAISGTRQAVSRAIIWKLKGLIRNNFFQEKESKIVADTLVSLIREAADTARFGQYIGRNCMVVTMTPNPNDGFVAKYYPAKASPYQYTPHLLTPPGIAIKGVQVWTGKGLPLWRNARRSP